MSYLGASLYTTDYLIRNTWHQNFYNVSTTDSWDIEIEKLLTLFDDCNIISSKNFNLYTVNGDTCSEKYIEN